MVTGIGNIISASGYGSYTPSMGFGANNYMYYGQYGTLMGGSNNAWYQPYSSGYGPSIVWGNNIDIQANNIAQCIISGAGHSWYNYHFTTSLFMGGAGHYTYGYSYVGGAFIWGRNHRIYEFQEGMATGGNHTLYEAVHSCVAGDSHRIGPSQGGSPEGHVSMGARTWNQNEGEWLFAGDHTIAGNSNVGQAQTGQAISSLRTTDATQGTFRPGSSTTERFYLRDNSTVAFRINITARQDAGAAGTVGDTASWVVEGLVKRGVGAASAAVVGAPTGTGTPLFSDAAAATWSIAVDVDTATGILRIRGTGEASKTIDWTAHIFFSEAGTGTAL
jgi:hypothetical protein